MSAKIHKIVSVSLILILLSSLGAPRDSHAQRFKPSDDTIAEIAVTDGNLTTLVAALSCTGLVGAVADPDAELTVFAPSDEAFAVAGLNATNICSTFDTETLTTILLPPGRRRR